MRSWRDYFFAMDLQAKVCLSKEFVDISKKKKYPHVSQMRYIAKWITDRSCSIDFFFFEKQEELNTQKLAG